MPPSAHDPSLSERLRLNGILLDGHFRLSSGLHSPHYLEKFNLLQWPHLTAEACAPLVSTARVLAPTVIAGPTTGGAIVAYEIARQLGVRTVIAEPNPTHHGRHIGRNYRIASGDRVFVVDDVLTSGSSLRATIAAVRAADGYPIAAGVVFNRSADPPDLGIPFSAAHDLHLDVFADNDCPLCRAGIPIRAT